VTTQGFYRPLDVSGDNYRDVTLAAGELCSGNRRTILGVALAILIMLDATVLPCAALRRTTAWAAIT
jgi:hypothetical protein